MSDTLIVFRNRTLANLAGFTCHTRHETAKHVWAWWPDLGMSEILGKPWQTVIVTHEAIASHAVKPGFEDARQLLRRKTEMWGAEGVYLEL